MINNFSKVTRLEIVCHTKCDNCHGSGKLRVEGQPKLFECSSCYGMGSIGKEVIFSNSNKQIDAQLQNDGRTLKIFVDKREI